MKPVILIKFPEATYQVLTDVIVQNRAKYMHEHVSGEYPTIDDATAGTIKLFEDEKEIRDWAVQFMDWSDLVGSAMMISADPDRDITTADWSYADGLSTPGPISAVAIDDVPLGLVLGNMMTRGSLCSFMLAGDSLAIAAIHTSDPEILGAYAKALKQLTEQISPHPHGEAPEPGRIVLAH